MEAQELLSEYKEKLFYCEDDQELAQVAQRVNGVSILGDIPKPSGNDLSNLL